MDEPVVLLNRFMLALCVWREARGETQRGRRLVAQVIKNRVADKRWPHDYVGVILQPKQFSSFNANDPNAVQFPHVDDPQWASCVAAADVVFGTLIPFTTANHYHVIGLSPDWRDDTKIVATEGHHVFYCL